MKSEKTLPRVLVTSVPSWSSKTGSDTFSSLFQEYDAEKVAALYIRADKSDSPNASRYFHIFEGRVLKSIYKRHIITGEEFSPIQVDVNICENEELSENRRYGKFKRHPWQALILLRELMWKMGRWKSPELENFINDFQPEVLVCPIESYIHFNSINEYIIKKCHPRVIGFLWDDNFTYKQSRNFWHLIHRFFVRRSVRRMVNKCDVVFSLSPKMKEEADVEFGIESQLLTKPIFNNKEYYPYIPSKPIRILYTGKLIIGRDESIANVVEAIRLVNTNEQKVVLDIYTNTELEPNMRERINVSGCCNLHGSVPQREVFELQKKADVLLFSESLSSKNLAARLSFSTKLTDYFAAGKCVWGIGHYDLGPISYLKTEDAGLVSCSKEEIIRVLREFINKPEMIIAYAEKAYACGQRNHNGKVIVEKLHKAIIGVDIN